MKVVQPGSFWHRLSMAIAKFDRKPIDEAKMTEDGFYWVRLRIQGTALPRGEPYVIHHQRGLVFPGVNGAVQTIKAFEEIADILEGPLTPPGARGLRERAESAEAAMHCWECPACKYSDGYARSARAHFALYPLGAKGARDE